MLCATSSAHRVHTCGNLRVSVTVDCQGILKRRGAESAEEVLKELCVLCDSAFQTSTRNLEAHPLGAPMATRKSKSRKRERRTFTKEFKQGMGPINYVLFLSFFRISAISHRLSWLAMSHWSGNLPELTQFVLTWAVVWRASTVRCRAVNFRLSLKTSALK